MASSAEAEQIKSRRSTESHRSFGTSSGNTLDVPPSSNSSGSTRSSFGSFAFASAFLGQLRRLSHNSDKSQNINENQYNHSEGSAILDPPPLTPIELLGYSPKTKNRIMDSELAEEIRGLIPARHQLYDTWTLVYSLEQHGASLATLYGNSQPKITYGGSEEQSQHRNGYVLVVRDTTHKRFGAYVNEYFHTITVPGSRRFYGNGDCFLWSASTIKTEVLNPYNDKESQSASETGDTNDDNTTKEENSGYQLQFKGFPYTGVNDFVIFCTPQFLSLGGGDGHYGLWLDDNLEHGVSSHSLTFGNEPLSDMGKTFDIVGVEVWRIG